MYLIICKPTSSGSRLRRPARAPPVSRPPLPVPRMMFLSSGALPLDPPPPGIETGAVRVVDEVLDGTALRGGLGPRSTSARRPASSATRSFSASIINCMRAREVRLLLGLVDELVVALVGVAPGVEWGIRQPEIEEGHRVVVVRDPTLPRELELAVGLQLELPVEGLYLDVDLRPEVVLELRLQEGGDVARGAVVVSEQLDWGSRRPPPRGPARRASSPPRG